MSVTSTETVIAASNNNSIRSLGASIDSLSSPRQKNSQVSKVYKQASTLFLTREFAETFSTLQPVLTVPERSREDAAADDEEEEELEHLAPIATASRSSRVKVWSLYLTLLNTIIELGPEEGKAALGSKQWRDIATKVRNGTIWDEVVRIGYRGIEGHVDADVVTNLATLLLSHSASQSTNQEHLESYLATSDHPHAPPAPSSKSKDPFATPTNSPKNNSYRESSPPTTNGATNTPHALASRLKILELYILHVLPANSQWEYARDFIQINDTLDDERKELFSHALEALEAEKTDGKRGEEVSKITEDLSSSQDLQHAEPRLIEELDPHEQQHHRRPNSEHDYGIIDEEEQQATAGSSTNPPTNKKPTNPPPHKPPPSAQQPPPPPSTRPTKPPTPSKTSHRKQKPNINTNIGILHHSKALLSLLQKLILNISSSVSANPLALLRFVLFVVALVVALGRRDVRERVGRMWGKVRGTVGMGVRVSYI
ncbi:MAG: hypothetical protein LQ350_000365 [Teloschistes chrysophthalmus]|nr:MAG: hypothetical protein LQ350_000365 [Niorma chrysophthalma]